MKIYTRTGDRGDTGLFAGARVPKDDSRIEAFGTVDELNATLGLARAIGLALELDAVVERVQHELFSVGAELATPDPVKTGTRTIGDPHIQRLEADIDEHEQRLPPLTQFILPGGVRTAAVLHQARAVCRRAERRVVTLQRADTRVALDLVRYLNRLADLLFVLARRENQLAGSADVAWSKPD